MVGLLLHRQLLLLLLLGGDQRRGVGHDLADGLVVAAELVHAHAVPPAVVAAGLLAPSLAAPLQNIAGIMWDSLLFKDQVNVIFGRYLVELRILYDMRLLFSSIGIITSNYIPDGLRVGGQVDVLTFDIHLLILILNTNIDTKY